TENPVMAVDFSPCSTMLSISYHNALITVHEVPSGRQISQMLGHVEWAERAVFSHDSRWLLSGGFDTTVRLWDVQTGSELIRMEGHESWVSDVAFTPDACRAISASADGTIRIWDSADG